MDSKEESTQPSDEAELRAAAQRLIRARMELWNASDALEAMLGFDVDGVGDELGNLCVGIDSPEDVTDEEADLLLAALREEQEEDA